MFYDNLKKICDAKGLKITPIVEECGGAKGSISNWKKGAAPNSDIVAKLAVRLNVSSDLLIFGEERTVVPVDISNSNIGAVGNNLTGTLNINNGNMTYGNSSPINNETLANVDNSCSNENGNKCRSTSNETELLKVFNTFSQREQIQFLHTAYEFEESYASSEGIENKSSPIGELCDLSENEEELLQVFNALSRRGKIQLLYKAYEFEENSVKKNSK